MSNTAKMLLALIAALVCSMSAYGFKPAGPIVKYHPSANGRYALDQQSGSVIDLAKNQVVWHINFSLGSGYYYVSNDGMRVIQVADKHYGYCYWDISDSNDQTSLYEQKYCVKVHGPEGLIKQHRLADLCKSLDHDWLGEIIIGTDFMRAWLESATFDGDTVKVRTADYRVYTISFQDGEIKGYRRIYSLLWLWPYFAGITILALIALLIILIVKKRCRKRTTSAPPLLP